MTENDESTRLMEACRPGRDAGNGAEARLVCVGGALKGMEIKLEKGEYSVGRDADKNSVSLEDKSISRQHARIYRESDKWAIEDLKSTNGVWLNDSRVQKGYLDAGELVKIGSVSFRFEMDRPATPSREITLLPMNPSDSMKRIRNLPYIFLDENDNDYFKVVSTGQDLHGIQLLSEKKSLSITRTLDKESKGSFDVQKDQSLTITDRNRDYPLNANDILNLNMAEADSEITRYKVIIPRSASKGDDDADKTLFFGGDDADKTTFGGSVAINKFMKAATEDKEAEDQPRQAEQPATTPPTLKVYSQETASPPKIKGKLLTVALAVCLLIGAGGYFAYIGYQKGKIEKITVLKVKREIDLFISTYEKRVAESPKEMPHIEELQRQAKKASDTFPDNMEIKDLLTKARFFGFERELKKFVTTGKGEKASLLIKEASRDFTGGRRESDLMLLAGYVAEVEIFRRENPLFPVNSEEVPGFSRVEKIAGIAQDITKKYRENNQILTIYYNYLGRMAKDAVDNGLTLVLHWQRFWREYQEYAVETSQTKKKEKLKQLRGKYQKIKMLRQTKTP